MTQQKHYFIAIPLPLELEDYFTAWQSEIKKHVAYKEWPYKEDLHITLKFLGAVDSESLFQLDQTLKQLEDFSIFSTEVGSIGVFGKADQPRVLWAGVDNIPSLLQLQQLVEASATKIGLHREERVYCPHITLAKKWDGPAATEQLQAIKQRYHTKKRILTVKEINLYRIHPQRVPKYEVVYKYRLLGEEADGTIN